MGIKGLNQLLNKISPGIFNEIHISKYAFKKVAVDTSIFVYKFKSSYGDRWLTYFVKFISSLRENQLHPLFIFDTGAAPPEKEQERVKRREKREYIKRKLWNLKDGLSHYETTGEILAEIEKYKEYRILNKEYVLNIDDVKNEIEKIEKQLVFVRENDFDTLKSILDILKINYYDAPMEAETMCSNLCKKGVVSAVLSEDTDCLTYGCTKLLTKYNYHSGLCTELSINNILDKADLNIDQFIDLCIMCGTDYNENIPKIGPYKSYRLLKKYISLDSIAEFTILDTKILNYNRVRDIFKNYIESSIENVEYCGIPTIYDLQNIVDKYEIDIDISILEKSYLPNQLVFEE